MTRFTKIMAVAAVLALAAFFFFWGSFFSMIGSFAGTSAKANFDRSEDFMALIRVEGPIVDASPVLAQLSRLTSNPACKGLLLRVDSPGGAVGASQELFLSLQRFAESKRPLVASMGNVAASGGYYIAMAGNKVFANPGTLTGSIGVLFQFPQAKELMDKVGVQMKTIKSGELKDIANPFRTTSEQEHVFLQELIEETHSQFLGHILESRPINREMLLQVADGRVVTGARARELGLLDTLGNLEDAKRYLAQETGLAVDADLIEEKPPGAFIEELADILSSRILGRWSSTVERGAFFLWQ